MENSDIHRCPKRKRHKWTREETIIVTVGYLQKNDAIDTQRLVPSISVGSVRMKYSNCKYLDKGAVSGSLKNASRMHKEVWNSMRFQNLISSLSLKAQKPKNTII